MSEKIEDIIREMRAEVRTSRENNPDPRTRIFLSTSNMAIEDFADRLEAADTMAHNESLLRKAGELCAGLMNKASAQDAEIAKLRALVKGLLEASSVSCADCNYDCGPDRDNCIIREAAKCIDEREAENG